ncbi:MAG: hypothetical protein AABX89_03775 [Candidatus Thermoplasmatota archaeon]|mgnify:CR=1 FL=1
MAEAPEGTPPLRRANRFAIAAFLAAVTSLLLPWWGLTASLGDVSGELVPAVRLWGGNPEVAHSWAVWLSTGLVVVAALLLFVRVAAASWRHEPARFRRDAALAAVLLAASCAAAWLWPVEFPFWGMRTYTDNVTGDPSVVTGSPLLGWGMAVVAACLAVASRFGTKPQP